MNVPNDHRMVPTCNGGLVNVKYELIASGSVTCAPSPKVTIPVTLYTHVPLYQKPMMPNW